MRGSQVFGPYLYPSGPREVEGRSVSILGGVAEGDTPGGSKQRELILPSPGLLRSASASVLRTPGRVPSPLHRQHVEEHTACRARPGQGVSSESLSAEAWGRGQGWGSPTTLRFAP